MINPFSLEGVWIEDGEESMWASQGPVTINGNSAPLGGGLFSHLNQGVVGLILFF